MDDETLLIVGVAICTAIAFITMTVAHILSRHKHPGTIPGIALLPPALVAAFLLPFFWLGKPERVDAVWSKLRKGLISYFRWWGVPIGEHDRATAPRPRFSTGLKMARYLYFGGPMPDVPKEYVPVMWHNREQMRDVIRIGKFVIVPLLIALIVLVSLAFILK
jgi:hypothetical protein